MSMIRPDVSPRDAAYRRAMILSNHLIFNGNPSEAMASDQSGGLSSNACVGFTPPELTETFAFDTTEMRNLLDCHNLEQRNWLYSLIQGGELFNPVVKAGRLYVAPDYNQTMEQHREMTTRRIRWLSEQGVFNGWCMDTGGEADLRNVAMQETLRNFDLSIGITTAVHFFLWGGAIRYLGTKPHHARWLKETERMNIKCCFAMTELGHGSNVRGIETVASYDPTTQEFIINTPCESAQKYWIGGAAIYSTYAAVFAQLTINGVNEGLHAFVLQMRDSNGNLLPNIRVADCGRKTGLNGIDNGQIWFDNVRVPRENLLNAYADVTPDGRYVSQKNKDERFAAFMASLTVGRVAIATSAVNTAKIGLAIAVRYALSRRAFSITPNEPEVLLIDYPSHQRRLFPLLAKTYALNFTGNAMKLMYANRTPDMFKALHVVSCTFKAMFTWHNMRTLQECREACGGQGIKTENRIGQLIAESDVQSTFEGDNNVLMQRVSREVLGLYVATKRSNRPFSSLGLEHLNESCPVLPTHLTSDILRSSQFQINAFCLRERDLLNRFAAKVSEFQAQGHSKAYSHDLAHLLSKDLGRAFSDRMILQTFITTEESLPAGSQKDILSLLRIMYALSCMEEDDAFLRYGYISNQNAAIVREEVEKLCSELRPHALALVSSFGLPDSFLCPIAFDWIEANSWSSSKLPPSTSAQFAGDDKMMHGQI